MARSKSGDGFSVDFSNLFPDEVTKQESTPKKKEKVEEKEEKSVEKRLEEQKEKKNQADPYTKTTETKAEEKENPVPILKTESPVLNQSIPKSNESETNRSEPKEQLIYITIYLESEEDRSYLKFRSKELSLSVSEFLWQMIEQDDLTQVNVTDSLHEKFRSTRLPLSTSVKATAEEKRIMQLHAAKHRLLMTRFIGFLIQKNRLSDSAWENI